MGYLDGLFTTLGNDIFRSSVKLLGVGRECLVLCPRSDQIVWLKNVSPIIRSTDELVLKTHDTPENLSEDLGLCSISNIPRLMK